MVAPLICPRCGHYVPSDVEPGVGPGVPSMAVASEAEQVLVCLPCGWHEASQKAHDELSSLDTWPIIVPERFYRGLGSC